MKKLTSGNMALYRDLLSTSETIKFCRKAFSCSLEGFDMARGILSVPMNACANVEYAIFTHIKKIILTDLG